LRSLRALLVMRVFAMAVLAMMLAMAFGMSESLGPVPWPWAALANAALILQFPLVHSLLLTRRGGRGCRAWPPWRDAVDDQLRHIASLQLLALFAFWTPSGIVWWRAEGAVLWLTLTPMPQAGFSWSRPAGTRVRRCSRARWAG
jgi:hypothetical protein